MVARGREVEPIKKLLGRRSSKNDDREKTVRELYGKYDDPKTAGWQGTNMLPRGTKHPGRGPF